MKGIVFTEFLDMVEENYGPTILEETIDSAQVSSQGAYTAVGTYDYSELISLTGALAQLTNERPQDLTKNFGLYMFERFSHLYPVFFSEVHSSFDFLQSIEGFIHVEVKKLYPDAELPTFDHRVIEPNVMELIYSSDRPFGDFAEGLIQGCVNYFQEPILITRENLKGSKASTVRFLLTITPSNA